MDEFEPKLIYLVKRNPSLSREAFTKRWRQHGQLGMSLPRWRNIARYVHCDALRPEIATPAISTAYDGIGLIWHRSRAARAAHVADSTSRITMERDEFETFSEPVTNSCLIARETVIKAYTVAQAGAQCLARKLIFFRPERPEVALERGEAQRRHENVPITEYLNDAGIDFQGHTINDPLRPENASGWGLKFGAVEELWFADERSAVAAATIVGGACREPGTTLVLTNEIVLYAPN